MKRIKKTPIENIEDIEILNFIEEGYKVKMLKLSNSSLAIDTPQDLKAANKLLSNN